MSPLLNTNKKITMVQFLPAKPIHSIFKHSNEGRNLSLLLANFFEVFIKYKYLASKQHKTKMINITKCV